MTKVFWGPYFQLFEFYYYILSIVHFKSWVWVSSPKVHSAPFNFHIKHYKSCFPWVGHRWGRGEHRWYRHSFFLLRRTTRSTPSPTRAINLLISRRNTNRQLWRYVGLQMKEELSLLIFRFIALVWTLGEGGLLSDLFPLPSTFYL